MPQKTQIRALFDHIAPDYDRLNRLMSLGLDESWRRKAIRKLCRDGCPRRVLDVASGTADFAMDAARQLADSSQVVGVDISEQMLAVGRNKVKKAGLQDKVVLQVADAENLPFDDASFDSVTVAFGVRNFEHLSQGLAEMCRVLRPGGQAIILELSYPDKPFLLWCYKLYAVRLLPKVCGWLSGNKEAYRYLPESIMKFPKPALFVPMLKDAGFTKVAVRSFTFGVCRMYVAEKE
ncbi:MAG: bifunctional demethylmenaquinone methyltransferase/2-methoxy-6-polyprenyl-1,4-benzoquinol methylase UbiE [Bacteroidales bacterium]|nr:bifunctional demethylmenaquinone methyltransferase/2-methoxy-6-polyprenyl-1,4-benzoquinol methylase UbiE [Bacteroidales bacterium]